MKRLFNKNYLTETLCLPEGALQNHVVIDTADLTTHEIIFKDMDGRFYKTHYSALNKSALWPTDKERNVECIEVEKEEIIFIHWKEKKDE